MAEKKTRKSGLGKGLGSLFSEPADDFIESINSGDKASDMIAVADIEPNRNQPRKSFDEEKLNALADSIKEHGIISPIIVTATKNGTYKIVAGERRFRAAKKAGLHELPCIIKDFDDMKASEIALVENLQRDDLNAIEEAEGYLYLMDKFDMTQDDVSKKIGKSRSAVANALRLNNLCDAVKELLKADKLTSGHARCLVTLDEARQTELAEKIIAQGLTVRQAEQLSKLTGEPKTQTTKKSINPMTQKYYREVESNLSSRFGTKVKISEGTKKGKIEIEYYTRDDLERILFELKK